MAFDGASVFIEKICLSMKCDFLFAVDPLSGSIATLVRFSKRLLAFGRSLSGDRRQVPDANQIVGSGSELKDPTDPVHSAVPGLAQQPDSFQPAEDFFHPLALLLTDAVPRMPSGSQSPTTLTPGAFAGTAR